MEVVLGRLAIRGGLPGPVRALVARSTGFQQVLARRSSVEAVLGVADVAVPYGPVSSRLGLGAFPLSLDGPEHVRSRALVAEALHAGRAAHQAGVADAASTAAAALGRAGATIDVLAEVVDPALVRWVEAWFGLPPGEVELLATSRVVTAAIFLDPPRPSGRRDRDLLQAAVDRSLAFRTQVAPLVRLAASGSLAAELLAAVGRADVAAAHLLGLTVGPLALGSWAIAEALVDLLEQPPGLDDLTAASGPDRFLRAVERRPPLPGLPRVNGHERRVLGVRSLVRVPAGTVLAATRVAARADLVGSSGPEPVEPGLAFGSGPHACLGPHLVAGAAGAILAELAVRRPRLVVAGHRQPVAGVSPTGRPWLMPARLDLELAQLP